MSDLEEKLGYTFEQKGLLRTALTHSSYANERHRQSYERLEFLGDSILGMMVAEYLYTKYPNLSEGELTRKRASLVCEEALVEVSKGLGLEREILLGRGEQNLPKPSILADVVEAILAAIYTDGGVVPAKKMVETLILSQEGKRISGITDYKSALQERLQQKGSQQILYTTIEETGPDHMKEFFVEVCVNGTPSGRGKGKTKKESEQQAAKVALSKLDKS
ncbi:MAG: ribonuclease III [Eubacteriales bacterium]